MKSTKDDYIKRSAARHAVLHHTGDAARVAIQNIPPEDVAPVVHSQWFIDNDGDVRCKHCNSRGLRDDIGIYITSEYCPNCGAKMYQTWREAI